MTNCPKGAVHICQWNIISPNADSHLSPWGWSGQVLGCAEWRSSHPCKQPFLLLLLQNQDSLINPLPLPFFASSINGNCSKTKHNVKMDASSPLPQKSDIQRSTPSSSNAPVDLKPHHPSYSISRHAVVGRRTSPVVNTKNPLAMWIDTNL